MVGFHFRAQYEQLRPLMKFGRLLQKYWRPKTLFVLFQRICVEFCGDSFSQNTSIFGGLCVLWFSQKQNKISLYRMLYIRHMSPQTRTSKTSGLSSLSCLRRKRRISCVSTLGLLAPGQDAHYALCTIFHIFFKSLLKTIFMCILYWIYSLL